MAELWELGARELRDKIAAGEVSCREVADAHLGRAELVDGDVRAFVTLTTEAALEQADRWDQARAAGEELPPLAGVPVALKDNFCTRGIRTTCSSRILGNWKPPYDATVTTLVREAGGVLVGKTNMDEFAMGSSTENSGLFATRNPWDLERVPGGSSGGSAAVVAARMAPLSLGSDTGGSIRQPAALCGAVGVKPTYGRVSRYGLVAYASSLDQIGPFARTVEDAALLLSAIARHDPLDSTSAPLETPDYTAALTGDVRGLRIGVPKEYFAEGIHDDVRRSVEAALDVYRELGAIIEETSTPHAEYALASYYVIAPAEASSNLARYDGVRYGTRDLRSDDVIGMFELTRDQGFGAEVKERIMLGTYALSAGYYDAYYEKALRVRTLVKQDLDRCWERFDVLLTPTSPEVAFRIGEKADDPLAMKLSDICTIPINMAGTCAASIPCGFSNGLPIGLQIIGRPFEEATMLRAAHAYEQATEWHQRVAPV
ncbi:MAG: aspartyl/glutamyl-tRNA(Asn/Gln) amidotransferase subunit [Armatimonadetes bacterium]|jgi:aspartyl-tRNA(Asn)/glutamyl-tRNA(Gln) amidotransferase subunit A|nr:aspartyl/glutamyl-tRNA(Asn/Gln) amidotransferase subunit [Armatimonadota bacterium]